MNPALLIAILLGPVQFFIPIEHLSIKIAVLVIQFTALFIGATRILKWEKNLLYLLIR